MVLLVEEGRVQAEGEAAAGMSIYWALQVTQDCVCLAVALRLQCSPMVLEILYSFHVIRFAALQGVIMHHLVID